MRFTYWRQDQRRLCTEAAGLSIWPIGRFGPARQDKA